MTRNTPTIVHLGKTRKGGTNPPPTTPRPNARPGGQRPAVITKGGTATMDGLYIGQRLLICTRCRIDYHICHCRKLSVSFADEPIKPSGNVAGCLAAGKTHVRTTRNKGKQGSAIVGQ